MGMDQITNAFLCRRCSAVPADQMAVFKPTDDRLVAYPELKLLHIHFGVSTHTDELSIAEAKFHWQWLEQVTKPYPNIQWFFITDFTRKDDSEFVVDEAKAIYTKIRHHPKLAAGAICGPTYAMKMFINVLFFFGGTQTVVVDTLAQAEEHYQKWWNKKPH